MRTILVRGPTTGRSPAGTSAWGGGAGRVPTSAPTVATVATVPRQGTVIVPAGSQPPEGAVEVATIIDEPNLPPAVQAGSGGGRGGRASGKVPRVAGKADCAWCQYGKPAAAGAAVGAVLSALVGAQVTSGALLGGAGGLFYGWMQDE